MDCKRPKSERSAARMCPRCACDSVVYRSEEMPDGSIVRKRRCRACGKRFKTLEKFLGELDIPDKD